MRHDVSMKHFHTFPSHHPRTPSYTCPISSNRHLHPVSHLIGARCCRKARPDACFPRIYPSYDVRWRIARY